MSSTSASTTAAPAAAAANGAASAAPNVASCCPHEKWHYERCFQRWYNAEYLTGRSQDLSGCQDLFDTYRSCVIQHYEKNEPEFLVQAAGASDTLLQESGHTPFKTKYPNLDKINITKEKQTTTQTK